MKKVTVHSIASVSAGQGAPKKNEFSEQGIPFIRAGSLEDLLAGKSEADFELVSEETAKKRKLKLYPKGSILFAKSGVSATKGRIYVLQNPAYVVSHLAILIPNDKIHGEYLRLVLNQFPPSRLIKDPAYPAISLAEIKKYKIPVPEELDDQKRIAHLLGKVEGLIARRKQHLQQLDELLKSVFLEMFGDPVRNEKGWETNKLGEIALIERGRFSPRPRNDPKYYNGAHPFIQTGDISRSNGRLKNYTQTLNDLGIKVSKEFKVGTIVIAIVGATIGETAILEIPTYAPDSVIGITPKTQDMGEESIFIEHILRFWKPVLRAKAPEAARANINIETLRPLPIIRPSHDDIVKFSITSTKLEDIKTLYKQSLAELENLYGALSQKAFKDELDLSRIPLVIKEQDEQQEDESGVKAEEMTDEKAKAVELSTPDDLADLANVNKRQSLIENWLASYLEQLDGKAFNIGQFMQLAQLKLDELIEDEPPELGVDEYDWIKERVFQLLENGQMKQAYDDAKNRVQLSINGQQE